MRVVDQSLELGRVRAGELNLQRRRKIETVVRVERHFASDARILAVEAMLLGKAEDRLPEAGRPAEREELLGIVSFAIAADFLLQTHGERKPVVLQEGAAVAAALGRC